ncbi:MAG: methyltransferase [Chloroflexi bacterium]|nr:methyltransferase [Chloroflexota bacterium]
MIRGYRTPFLINVAAKLGIADLLRDGPKSSEELAQAVEAQPRFLYRVLRALASQGIFAENEAGQFQLTPVAELLQTGIPGSLRATAIMSAGLYARSWGDLLYTLRTGKPSFDHVFGMGFWEYLDSNDEMGDYFNQSMTSRSGEEQGQVVDAYDFSGISKIVDVGGGQGSLIRAILQKHPHMHGTLFDLPEVVQGVYEIIEAEGLAERCEVVGGSFFDEVPSEGEAYFMQAVIHDWDDERSLSILKNCRRAIGNNGKLILVEAIIPSGNEPSPMKMGDINMMVLAGGLERTETEFRQLLDAAGFKLVNIIPIQPRSIIESVPV